MAYSNEASSSRNYQNPQQLPPITTAPEFDILDWHPAYQSCQRYFLDHAQHEPGTQALCALINIRLPHQWRINPIYTSNPASQVPGSNGQQSSSSTFNLNSWPPSNRNGSQSQTPPVFVSLIPYVRRLVITGFDKPGVLHGLFGDLWQAGISPLQECERRNYLFAAKHGGWRSCKKQYDLNEEETVPFLKPLQSVKQEELEAADKSWSSWLAMEDWMIGPRAPNAGDNSEAEMQQLRGGGVAFEAGLPDGVPDQLRR